MKRILLITAGLSAIILADLSKTGNIVTDTTTGLQWQDNETVNKKWDEAIDYCEALNLDGYDDWRLPNIKELTSLVDDNNVNPSISSVFEHTISGYYWSSTTYSGGSDVAWGILFDSGAQSTYGKRGGPYVRCARAGQ